MMPPAPQIPGFYYDPEKRKYFKIEEHVHHSHPYSKENLAKRRKAEEQRARQAKEERVRSENLAKLRPFQRLTHTAANVGGYMNAREFGLATTLVDREALQARLFRRQKVFQVRATESELQKLTCFAVRESSGHAIFGTHGGLVHSMLVKHVETNVRLVGCREVMARFTSMVTAIAFSQNSQSDLFVCCSLGKDNYSGAIQIGRFGQNEDRVCEIFSIMKPKRKQDVYCLAMNRYVPEEFAVGGEYDVLVSSGGNEQTLPSPGNCLAMEFLGPHTLATGTRNGIIRVYDFRGQEEKITATRLSIRHPSSVSQMRQVDDHLIVVAGLQNSLATYDLRNPKTFGNSTTPIVKYSGHVNSVTHNLGFDVSPSESTLAAAGDDGFVRLWSIQSGQRLCAKISQTSFDNVVGLHFSRQPDNGIWVAGSELEYWGI